MRLTSAVNAIPIHLYRPVRAAVLSAASARGKARLARVARETGGAPFEVSKQQTIEAIYAQIEESLDPPPFHKLFTPRQLCRAFALR
jgi:hypothetical protein